MKAKLLENLEKLAEKVSFTYDIQWERLDDEFARTLLEKTYQDALELIPTAEKKVLENYPDQADDDWNEAIEDDEIEEFTNLISDPYVGLLYELYTVKYLYAKIQAIKDITDNHV